MSQYLLPDLTGENVLYKISNDVKRIIKQDQVVSLYDSAFKDTLVITLLGTTNNKDTQRTLVEGDDWVIQDSDIDYSAMSDMKLLDNTFDRTLIKSVTFTKPFVAEYNVNFAYQRLYPVTSEVLIRQSDHIVEFTPDVLLAMMQDLTMLKRITQPVKDNIGDVDGTPLLLEPDPHKTKPENFISGEIHEINVPNQVDIIHPLAGTFFKDSLEVYSIGAEKDTLLVENEDYKVWEPNFFKLHWTTNTSGLFNFIVIIKPYVGRIKINYHAYGGQCTLYDMREMRETQENIIRYITDTQMITADTIGETKFAQLLLTRMAALEEQMRILAKNGLPSYGDVTSGKAILRKIQSSDTDFHWWTIASLYKVAGSDTVFTADTMNLHIETEHTKFLFDANIAVNIENPVNKMDVGILSAVYPLGYIPFEDYSDLDNIIRPQFRIIWNQSVKESSGIYLQIGLRLKGMSEETVAIQDLSGNESCWKLVDPDNPDDPGHVVTPQDTEIYLPNENALWSISNTDSRQDSTLIPFKEGSIVWAGTEPLNRSAGWVHLDLEHFLEDEVDITKIRSIRCDLEESEANRFPVCLPVIHGLSTLTGSTSFTYNGKSGSLSATIRRNPVSKKIEISLDAEITAGIASTALNLKHVIIYC